MKSNKVLAFLLAFVALFAITVPTTVRADGDEPVYEKLYFISDSLEYYDYECSAVNSVGRTYGFSTSNIITVNFSQSGICDDPFHAFDDYCTDIDNNSIVILEIQTRMQPVESSDECQISATQHLYHAFSDLKDKNCKIMFISANDEDTLNWCNSFLSFVDVHVNVDFIYAFVKGIVSTVEEDNLDNNFFFITDSQLCNILTVKNDFSKKWLYPYFEEIYISDYYEYVFDNEGTRLTFYDYLFEVRGIRLYGQAYADDTVLVDYLHSWKATNRMNVAPTIMVEFDLSTPESLFINGVDKAYVLGVQKQSNVGGRWRSMVNNLKTALLPDNVFTAMAQNELTDPLGIGEYISVGYTKLLFYGAATTSDERYNDIYTFDDIVTDFVAGNDMYKYNNVGGVSEITYMPVTISADGWFPVHLVMNCFQIFD